MAEALDGGSGGHEALRSADRVCIFSHHSAAGALAGYVVLHLQAIGAAGFQIVFISTSALQAADRRRLEALCALVVVRANTGFDFGSWRLGLTLLGELRPGLLLLTNDSVYGPFCDFGLYLDRLMRTPADAWGAIESSAFGRHLQSWFLLLTPQAYRSRAFAELLGEPIDGSVSKWALVQRYELGLSAALLAEGLRLSAGYVAQDHGALARTTPFNPCGVLWRELLEGPVPYVKTSILRANPTLSPGVDRWRQVCDRLDPVVAAAVADDLAARGDKPPTVLWDRLRRSLKRTDPVDWPEVQRVLRANHRRRTGSPWETVDALAFKVVRGLGGLARGVWRRAGDQLAT